MILIEYTNNFKRITDMGGSDSFTENVVSLYYRVYYFIIFCTYDACVRRYVATATYCSPVSRVVRG
jgi:hypothetical protein